MIIMPTISRRLDLEAVIKLNFIASKNVSVH